MTEASLRIVGRIKLPLKQTGPQATDTVIMVSSEHHQEYSEADDLMLNKLKGIIANTSNDWM